MSSSIALDVSRDIFSVHLRTAGNQRIHLRTAGNQRKVRAQAKSSRCKKIERGGRNGREAHTEHSTVPQKYDAATEVILEIGRAHV